MDDTDRRLIGLLRDDARLPLATLAKHLGVSRGTVQNRLKRLTDDGTILGFTARLGSEAAENDGVRAVTLVNENAKTVAPLLRALRQIPEVRTVHTTNGRWDLMIEMAAANLAALDEALSLMRRVPGITATETLILLTPHKL